MNHEALIKLAIKYNLKRIKLGDFEAELDTTAKVEAERNALIQKALQPSKEELEAEEDELLYASGL